MSHPAVNDCQDTESKENKYCKNMSFYNSILGTIDLR